VAGYLIKIEFLTQDPESIGTPEYIIQESSTYDMYQYTWRSINNEGYGRKTKQGLTFSNSNKIQKFFFINHLEKSPTVLNLS